jgi:hypothetical protein
MLNCRSFSPSEIGVCSSGFKREEARLSGIREEADISPESQFEIRKLPPIDILDSELAAAVDKAT